MGRSFGAIKNKFLLPTSLAPIAQLVEQLPLKEMVQGSNPCGRTKDTNTSPAGGFVLLCEPEPCPAIAGRRGRVVRQKLRRQFLNA